MENSLRSLLIFSKSDSDIAIHFKQLISTRGVTTEYFGSISTFSKRLRKPIHTIMGAIIVTGNVDELEGVITIKDLLVDIPILVILPDKEKDTVSKGFSLKPRLLEYVDSDFNSVAPLFNGLIDHWLTVRY